MAYKQQRPISVVEGGTGATTFANRRVLIGTGTTAVTTSDFDINAASQMTNRSQTAFEGNNQASSLNVTGDGTSVLVTFATVNYNQNSNFDGLRTYTAPVDGIYRFQFQITMGGLTASHTLGAIQVQTSNFIYQPWACNVAAMRWGGQFLTLSGYTDTFMDAADTCSIQLTVSFGALVVDILGNIFISSPFSGGLIY